ncbi:MAG: transglutaminase-like domain-containing protein, partial [Candidatus Thermoplasmatota archaeon]
MRKQKIGILKISILTSIIIFGIFSSSVLSEKQNTKNINLNYNIISKDDKDIFLQRVEHYLYLKAEESEQNFIVNYSFPPDYNHQVPILLEIFDDSTANIIEYDIVDDFNKPNQLAKFIIGSIQKDEIVLIHFTCWVLLFNNDFSDLPYYVKIPNRKEIPEEYIIWLSSTNVVQKNRVLIKYHAQNLKGGGDNLINFASNISGFIKNHRYFLFLIQLNLKVFFSQDALTTLFINGENVGRSHLACALLRSNNIPSRVLLVNNDQGFWTQMHYMVEYYCPNYGWVLIDSTMGKTPYETNKQ